MDRLPDQLQPHLRLVFVGTATSQRSADLGHYYAHPGNRFKRTIHDVGLTPRRFSRTSFQPCWSGVSASPTCANLAREWTIRRSPCPSIVRLSTKKCCNIDQRKSPSPAITSKKAASLFYGRPTKTIALGRQPAEGDFPTVFVLGLAIRRRIGSQVRAAVAGAGGFDETHLRVSRKPDERGIIRPFGTTCPQRGQPDRMTLTTAETPTNAGKP